MTMKLAVPAGFSAEYLRGLERLLGQAGSATPPALIDNAYGAMPSSVLGHSRYPEGVPQLSRGDLTQFIAELRTLGIRFHYVANSPWLDGLEREEKGQSNLKRELAQLQEAGVQAFILANPYLIHLVSSWFPDIDIVASINIRAASHYAVAQLLSMGARRVVVDRTVNRSFPLLRSLSASFQDRVVLLANTTCLLDCPLQGYHSLECAYSSTESPGRATSRDRWTEPDFCFDYCFGRLVEDPAHLLRIPWIRPEDIPLYRSAGVRHLKLQGRSLPVEQQLQLISMYLIGRSPNDDLFDLWPGLKQQLAARAEAGADLPERVSSLALSSAGFVEWFEESFLSQVSELEGQGQ